MSGASAWNEGQAGDDQSSSSSAIQVLKPENAELLKKLTVEDRNKVMRWVGKFAEEKSRADEVRKSGEQSEALRRRPLKTLIELHCQSSDEFFNYVSEERKKYEWDLKECAKVGQESELWRDAAVHFPYFDSCTFLDKWTLVTTIAGAEELFAECRSGKPSDIKRCLRGLDTSLDLCRIRDKSGRSAMHYVAMGGNAEVVACVVPLINSRDREGWTPLHHAAWHGHRATVEQLDKYGAYIEAVDDEGRTPFYYAVTSGMRNTALALLRCGAMVRKADASDLLQVENESLKR